MSRRVIGWIIPTIWLSALGCAPSLPPTVPSALSPGVGSVAPPAQSQQRRESVEAVPNRSNSADTRRIAVRNDTPFQHVILSLMDGLRVQSRATVDRETLGHLQLPSTGCVAIVQADFGTGVTRERTFNVCSRTELHLSEFFAPETTGVALSDPYLNPAHPPPAQSQQQRESAEAVPNVWSSADTRILDVLNDTPYPYVTLTSMDGPRVYSRTTVGGEISHLQLPGTSCVVIVQADFGSGATRERSFNVCRRRTTYNLMAFFIEPERGGDEPCSVERPDHCLPCSAELPDGCVQAPSAALPRVVRDRRRGPAPALEVALAARPPLRQPPVGASPVRATGGDCSARRAECQPGWGGFAQPSDLWVGSATRIQFSVAPDQAGVVEELDGAAAAPMRRIMLAARMQVQLLPDPNFEIVPLDPPSGEQPIGPDRRASWIWDVTPRGTNNQPYRLTAIVRALDQAGRQIDSYPKYVTVTVRIGTWRGFVNALQNAKSAGDLVSAASRSWETAVLSITAFVTALGGLFVAIRALRRKSGRQRVTAAKELVRRQRRPKGARSG